MLLNGSGYFGPMAISRWSECEWSELCEVCEEGEEVRQETKRGRRRPNMSDSERERERERKFTSKER